MLVVNGMIVQKSYKTVKMRYSNAYIVAVILQRPARVLKDHYYSRVQPNSFWLQVWQKRSLLSLK
jgi:hypothetical protein